MRHECDIILRRQTPEWDIIPNSKGVVSQDFLWLQIILLDRAKVPDIPLDAELEILSPVFHANRSFFYKKEQTALSLFLTSDESDALLYFGHKKGGKQGEKNEFQVFSSERSKAHS